MLQIRRGSERGVANLGWLYSQHSFSFGRYYDPQYTAFGPLLVINEDRVQAGQGFGTHSHSDMEIISYVVEGELAHQDSMGNGSVLRYGDVQRMSAGSGVQHSESNHSHVHPVHFLQIWIEPNEKGMDPSYEEKHFDAAAKQGKLCLIASPNGRDNSILIHQDTQIYAAILNGSDQVIYSFASGRNAYIHVIRGKLTANGTPLVAGDALKLIGEERVSLGQAEAAEILLFDLPH